MEPVTHMLTGAVLARTGFHRRTAWAVLAMAVAAEFPDIDTAWSVLGPVPGFAHHRGITHTFLALPFEAALLTGAVVLLVRLRARRGPPAGRGTLPVHAGWLFGGTLLALASHLLLDWTNNYGIRPFFPFDPHWFAGSFVFIFEPVLFLLLLAAMLLPGLFGLINSEVSSSGAGARRRTVSPAWSVAALMGVAVLYALRFVEHGLALEQAERTTPAASRVFASPYPIDPFRWATVTDLPDRYVLSTLDTRRGAVTTAQPSDTLFKPADTPALELARRSSLGRVYLDWSMFPVLQATPDTSDPAHPLLRVTFADARFLYLSSLFGGRLRSSGQPPLSGSVLLEPGARAGQGIVETTLDGRLQR